MAVKLRRDQNEERIKTCQNVFESILRGVITVENLVEALHRIKKKGINYTPLKHKLLEAGGLEDKIPTGNYSREDLRAGFGWSVDRTLQENLKKWRINHLKKDYPKDEIRAAAKKAGWELLEGDQANGIRDTWFKGASKNARDNSKAQTAKEFLED